MQSGGLRLLATFGARRTGYWPFVPTLIKSGVNDVMEGAYGLAGPKGMEMSIVNTLHDACKAAMDQPGFVAAVANFHQEANYLGSSQFLDFAFRQIEQQKRVVERLGFRLD